MLLDSVSSSDWDSVTALYVLIFVLVMVNFLMCRYSGPDIANAILENQADVSATRNPEESAVYRSHLVPHPMGLIRKLENGQIATLFDVFQYGKKLNSKKRYLGYRLNDGPFLFLNFQEVEEKITRIGSGLVAHCKLKPQTNAMIGIYMANSVAWACIDHACAHYSLVTVPLYETLPLTALTHIIQLTELSVIATTSLNIGNLVENIEKFSSLKTIVVCDTSEAIGSNNSGVQIVTLKDLEIIGSKNLQPHVPPKPSDIASICFTNGTMGTPKGAVLTHANLVAAATGVLKAIPRSFAISNRDSYISYLSLAHTFERTLFHSLTYLGCSVAFYQGSILKLIDDAQTFQPTIMPAIPQLLNRLYDKINAAVSSLSLAHQHVFWFSYRAKLKQLHNGQLRSGTIYDKIAFRRIQAKLGGRVRLIICGTGAVDTSVLEFFRVTIGCQVLNSYGLTETCSFATLMLPGDYADTLGNAHVGSPLPCNEIKLVSVPEMNHLVTDKPNPRGEICIRGHNVMQGYFKQQYEALEDGWFHTGDIGEILPNGVIKVIDRKEERTRLSEMEYNSVSDLACSKR